MNESEAEACIKVVKGLWPNETKERLKSVSDLLRYYNAKRATAVIRTHATNHEFLSLPNLKSALHADESKRETVSRIVRDETHAQLLRRELPKSYPAGMSDADVAWQFGREYRALLDSGVDRNGVVMDADALELSRHFCYANTRALFLAAGVDAQDSDEFAKELAGYPLDLPVPNPKLGPKANAMFKAAEVAS